MTSPTVVLTVADVALIKGVILTLASLNGDEIVVLGEVLSVVDPVLAAAGVTALSPGLRDSMAGSAEVPVAFSLQQLAMIRGQLFAKVKAFTSGDIAQVLRIRAALDTAITAAAAPKAG